ncbi:hypothetical protein OS493_024472, partial [Desmophyllum pertusum]
MGGMECPDVPESQNQNFGRNGKLNGEASQNSGEDLSNKEGLSSAQKRPRDLVQDTQENVLNKEGSPYPGQKRLKDPAHDTRQEDPLNNESSPYPGQKRHKVAPSEPTDKENRRHKEAGLTSK